VKKKVDPRRMIDMADFDDDDVLGPDESPFLLGVAMKMRGLSGPLTRLEREALAPVTDEEFASFIDGVVERVKTAEWAQS
jgi:hypothetical protein